jgi:hypothetical protein
MDRNIDRSESTTDAHATWQRPSVEVINLACELSAYAPDDGGPLF